MGLNGRRRLAEYVLVILCCVGLVGCRPSARTSAVNWEEHIQVVQDLTTEVKGLKEETGRVGDNLGALDERVVAAGAVIDESIEALGRDVEGLKNETSELSEEVTGLDKGIKTTGEVLDCAMEGLARGIEELSDEIECSNDKAGKECAELGDRIRELANEVRMLRLGKEDPNGSGRINEGSPRSLISRIISYLAGAGFNLAALIAFLALFVSIRSRRITSTRYSLVNIMGQAPRDLLDEIETKIKATPEGLLQDDAKAMKALGYLNMICKLFMHSAINVSILRTFEPNILRVFQNEYIGRIYRQKYQDLHNDRTIAEPPHINLLFVRRILTIVNPILNFQRGGKGTASKCISILSCHLSLCLALVLRFKFRYLTSQQRMWSLSEQAANESQETKGT